MEFLQLVRQACGFSVAGYLVRGWPDSDGSRWQILADRGRWLVIWLAGNSWPIVGWLAVT